ncbi:MAG TPA: LysR family transcriptional regulator [Usitatibacteraceae bacterium]|nr:LysR family transcriptional regulator [Usitatibacteraceae bacterium]
MAFDRLHAMTVFVHVVEQGGFARAAERLDLSASAASRRVAELESHLGARLLNRTTRRLSLTEAGQAFHERAIQLLADLEEAEATAASATARPKGTIKLTCSVAFGVRHLAPAIGAFQAVHPEVLFDVSLSDRFVDLVEEGVDLAVRIGELGNPALVARRIGQMRLVACAAPAYLQRHGTPRRPEDLVRHNCLSYEYAPTKGQWRFFDRKGTERRVRIAGSVHANSGEMLASIAAEGVGIALEPDFIVNPLIAAGRLVPILKSHPVPETGIYAVYPSRRHLSAKVRAFVDFLAQRFGRQCDWC